MPARSGLKVKRCCGVDGVRERTERAADALQEAFSLAFHFPRLRAAAPDFTTWAAAAAGDGLDRRLVVEGLAILDEAERARIVTTLAEEQPRAWCGIVDDVGDEDLAAKAVVTGAVAAALRERTAPDELGLRLLERDEGRADDPAELLSFALRGTDLWSVVEASEADAEVAAIDRELDDDEYELAWNAAFADEAERLWTPWHDERLAQLVARIDASLPFDGYPKVSAALAQACAEFRRDPGIARRVSPLLLSDAIPWLRNAAQASALARAA